ncbi:MAG: hypothetical protein ACLPN6_10130 [Streptosporangiaceae bacterium]|jgi:hypothetical protein|nr:hypothetical protein [Actinomycetota bacterium]
METAAESHLRLLAKQAVALAEPGDEFAAAWASLHAVAHACTMLGLITGPAAEAVLTAASAAVTARGLPASWLPGRPAGDDSWQRRSRGPAGLRWTPRVVAPGPARLATAVADLRFGWLRLSRGGLRFPLQAMSPGTGLLVRHAGLALAEVSLADDAGRRYQMYWDRGSGTARHWVGEVVARPAPPADAGWLEFRALGSPAAARVAVGAPRPGPAGPADPPWPTAAECYLALLCAQDPPPAIGRSRGRQVAAAVAEALYFTGAIPPDSPLLRRALGRARRSTRPARLAAWPDPVRQGMQPDVQIAVCAALPFAGSAVVIEGLCGWGEHIQLLLYGWPWTQGDCWPAAIPAFTVRVVDDQGGEHVGRLGGWTGYGEGEGRGEFTLWPAVPARVRRLRVIVSTLWEAAWADIELPPR